LLKGVGEQGGEVKTMKSATTVVVLVLTLLAWVSTASANIFKKVSYNFVTPTPDGEASCALLVSVTKLKGTSAKLRVGLGAGVQPGCDIFPDRPSATPLGGIPLDTSLDLLVFDWTLEVHAHPDADCTVGGVAKGAVLFILFGKPGEVQDLMVDLFCP
jgi:hypothetical protein